MSIRRFIAAESTTEDVFENGMDEEFDIRSGIYLEDADDLMMADASHAFDAMALESFKEDFSQSLDLEVRRHLGMEAWDDVDGDSENSLENKGDFLQRGRDWLSEELLGLGNKIRNPLANFFTGVNRALSQTDKLLKQARGMNKDSNFQGRTFSRRKGYNKLMAGGAMPKDVKALTREVIALREAGEWLINDYRKQIDGLGIAFADSLRNKKLNKWFDKEKIVDYFVEVFESTGFPVPRDAKPRTSHTKLYKEMAGNGLLGDAEIRAFVLDFRLINGVEGWEKLNMVCGQWLKVEKYSGKMGGNERIEMPMAKRDDLVELLLETEKLLNLAKKLSNEVKNNDSRKVFSKIIMGLEDFWDLLANTQVPISMVRYILTGVRRSIINFARAYNRWTWQTYSSYIRNAYAVSKNVNKLAKEMMNDY